MDLRQQDRAFSYVGVLLLLILIVNSLIFFFRLDLSRNQVYTISNLSRETAQKLRAPAQVTYYVSGKLSSQKAEIRTIIDILDEYSRISNGKVQFHLIDPDGKAADLKLEDQGIKTQEFQIVEHNQITSALVYSGIRIQYLDSNEVIPLVSDPGSIEYELTLALRHMINPKNRILGILSGGSGQDVDSQFTMLGQIFTKDIEVRFLKPGEAIPGDIDALFVLRDQGFSLIDAIHIDQFVMSGKGALFGVETIGVGLTGTWKGLPRESGIFTRLLTSYGITVTPGWVLDDFSYNMPMKQAQGQTANTQNLPYPAWIQVIGPNLNAENPISGRSAGLDLLWTSPVGLQPGVEGSLLASSSALSWVLKDGSVADPAQLHDLHLAEQENNRQKHGPQGLVVLREGHIASAFTDTELTQLLPGQTIPALIKATQKGRLLVIGSATFASDLYRALVENGLIAQPKNIIFLQNAVDWLTNNSEMLNLRTRIIKDERLTAIQNPELKDTLGTLALLLNAVLVPGSVAGFGIWRYFRRRNAHLKE